MIIFINGSINAGKSTVARLLKDRMARPALVEVDSLRAFIDGVGLDEAIPINLENAAAVIRNFARRGFNVIVPYPLSGADFAYLQDSLKDLGTAIHLFALRPSLDKALSDTPQRQLSSWERERIAHHYASGLVDPDFGSVIDTTFQTPEETAAVILSSVL